MLKIGSAESKAGTLSRGKIELIELPTGERATVPVVIATGEEPGPCLLVTGNIHGGEVVGTLVLHRFLEELEPQLAKLRGTVVAIPSLNPSGLLAQTRQSPYQAVDPNHELVGDTASHHACVGLNNGNVR